MEIPGVAIHLKQSYKSGHSKGSSPCGNIFSSWKELFCQWGTSHKGSFNCTQAKQVAGSSLHTDASWEAGKMGLSWRGLSESAKHSCFTWQAIIGTNKNGEGWSRTHRTRTGGSQLYQHLIPACSFFHGLSFNHLGSVPAENGAEWLEKIQGNLLGQFSLWEWGKGGVRFVLLNAAKHLCSSN